MSSMMMPPGGGGPPPDLMALLGGGGGPSPTGPTGVPTDMGAAPDPNDPNSGPAWLEQAISAVQNYMNVEKDNIDLHDASKVLTGLQSILARQQKEQEQALGVGAGARFLRRASGA